MNRIFSKDFFENKLIISDLIKIHPVRAELFHADRKMDGKTVGHDEGNSRFSQFCECA
jgi:hypothetical protein